jgi:hypothetical protein
MMKKEFDMNKQELETTAYKLVLWSQTALAW